MELAAHTLALAIVVFFLASVCHSVTGFGYALVAVPVLSLVVEPKEAVVASTLLGTALTIFLLAEVRGQVPVRPLLWPFVGALIGAPLGAVFLDRIDTHTLRYIIGVMVIGATLLLWRSEARLPIPNGAAAAFSAGFLSGVLRSATSMGGPPVILFFLGTESDRERFRRTLLAFWPLSSAVSIAALFYLGLITEDVLYLVAFPFPTIALGLLAGRYVRNILPLATFRASVLGLLVATALSVMILTPFQS